jgi:hypothetical protein
VTLDDIAGRAVITIPEAGELLGLKRSAAYECARRGQLPGHEAEGLAVTKGDALLCDKTLPLMVTS